MGQTNLPVIILAAGASSRMRGHDKLLEVVEGQPLIRRQAVMARAVSTGEVVIALPPAPHARYDALEGLDVTLLPIADAAEGMGASFRGAVAALPKASEGAMVLLGDLPELTESDLRTVAQSIDFASETLIWRGATEDTRPGHPIVFHAALFDALKALRGDIGGREIVAAAGDRVVLIPLPGNRARLDLDTPEEWAAWRKNARH